MAASVPSPGANEAHLVENGRASLAQQLNVKATAADKTELFHQLDRMQSELRRERELREAAQDSARLARRDRDRLLRRLRGGGTEDDPDDDEKHDGMPARCGEGVAAELLAADAPPPAAMSIRAAAGGADEAGGADCGAGRGSEDAH